MVIARGAKSDVHLRGIHPPYHTTEGTERASVQRSQSLDTINDLPTMRLLTLSDRSPRHWTAATPSASAQAQIHRVRPVASGRASSRRPS